MVIVNLRANNCRFVADIIDENRRKHKRTIEAASAACVVEQCRLFEEPQKIQAIKMAHQTERFDDSVLHC